VSHIGSRTLRDFDQADDDEQNREAAAKAHDSQLFEQEPALPVPSANTKRTADSGSCGCGRNIRRIRNPAWLSPTHPAHCQPESKNDQHDRPELTQPAKREHSQIIEQEENT